MYSIYVNEHWSEIKACEDSVPTIDTANSKDSKIMANLISCAWRSMCGGTLLERQHDFGEMQAERILLKEGNPCFPRLFHSDH